MKSKLFPRYLGTDKKGYKYYLDTDNYVYQENIFGRNVGWLCSYPAWQRTMHKIVED